jgi:predicted nucleotidyltransferase component of viral defense system
MNNNYFRLTDEQQKTVINQTANKIKLPLQAIEKDLWVTAMLQLIFSLPFANQMVFKGGTSLSKVWRVIERFSEDIDLAIDRQQFSLQGDLTIRQLKKLRKQSSQFVKEDICQALQEAIMKQGIKNLCTIEAETDGEGDKTYPEPRKIYVRYQSHFDSLKYLPSEIVLEIGARSLIEPVASHPVTSFISENLAIDTSFIHPNITTALPEKTFLEKAFLLHEIFSGTGSMTADRKSRHLYDLEKMMDRKFAVKAVSDNSLWNNIHHHREVFTHVKDVDYTPDIRSRIRLIPPHPVIDEWKQDYETMRSTMIYGVSLPFDELIHRLDVLQKRFHNTKNHVISS